MYDVRGATQWRWIIYIQTVDLVDPTIDGVWYQNWTNCTKPSWTHLDSELSKIFSCFCYYVESFRSLDQLVSCLCHCKMLRPAFIVFNPWKADLQASLQQEWQGIKTRTFNRATYSWCKFSLRPPACYTHSDLKSQMLRFFYRLNR